MQWVLNEMFYNFIQKKKHTKKKTPKLPVTISNAS